MTRAHDPRRANSLPSSSRNESLEALVRKISSDLLKRPWRELDAGLEAAMSGLLEEARADRSAILVVDQEAGCLRMLCEALAPDLDETIPPLDGRPLPGTPEISRSMRDGEAYWVADVEALEASAEAEVFRASGLKSVLVLPVREGDLRGCLVLSWFRGVAELEAREVVSLRLMADVLSYALAGRQANERLQESEQKLQQAQKLEAIGELAGGVAHDLNNLLTVVASGVERLEDSSRLDDKDREAVMQIDRASRQASSLISQLLAFGRRQRLVPRSVSLNERIQHLEQRLRKIAGTGIEVVLDLHEDLPPVYADPRQVDQVLIQLVNNATEAIEEGGLIRIETGATEREGRATAYLAVEDDGRGMEDEVRRRLFEPFFSTSGDPGSGLGLAVVHGIVHQSGGAIDVERPPRGSRFRVSLPAVPFGESAGRHGTCPPSDRQGAGGARILVVEDEEMVRLLTAATLRALGYEVVVAEDGRQGLELLTTSKRPFDLIVSDIVMPRLSGPEMIDQLPSCLASTPVLFMSGYSSQSFGTAPSNWPKSFEVDAILEKPFRPSQLRQRVVNLLGHQPASGLAS